MNLYYQYILLCISRWTISLRGSPIPTTGSQELSDIKDAMKMALDLAQKTHSAINSTLKYYCDNTPLMFSTSCTDFIDLLLQRMEATFPAMEIHENITISQTELFKMALLNISTTLSKYEVVLKNQVKREYDSLCAPATRIGVKCYYPAACSQLTPTSDAIIYCYLRHTLSYIVDLKLIVSLPVSSNMQDNIQVDDGLLAPQDIPLTVNRWFTMATLHSLLTHINHIQQTVKL
ncbi:uncharacterized protein LOC115213514 isoform X1 [Argonauta hians]